MILLFIFAPLIYILNYLYAESENKLYVVRCLFLMLVLVFNILFSALLPVEYTQHETTIKLNKNLNYNLLFIDDNTKSANHYYRLVDNQYNYCDFDFYKFKYIDNHDYKLYSQYIKYDKTKFKNKIFNFLSPIYNNSDSLIIKNTLYLPDLKLHSFKRKKI
jgi:hypothetical protein